MARIRMQGKQQFDFHHGQGDFLFSGVVVWRAHPPDISVGLTRWQIELEGVILEDVLHPAGHSIAPRDGAGWLEAYEAVYLAECESRDAWREDALEQVLNSGDD